MTFKKNLPATPMSSATDEPSFLSAEEEASYKEQALLDILAEFGSAPIVPEPQIASAEEALSTPPPTPTAETSAPVSAQTLVIDGIDFSEFLVDSPQSESEQEPIASPQASETPKPVPTSETDVQPRTQVRRRASSPGNIFLRIVAFAAVLATVVFLYTQTMHNRVSSADFADVSNAVLVSLDLTDMQAADAQMVKRLYGFSPSDFDGCMLYYPSSNMGAREVLVVKLSDLSQQNTVKDAIAARLQTQKNSFEGYGVEQYALLEQSVTEIQGNYILFVVHENASTVRQAFLNAL